MSNKVKKYFERAREVAKRGDDKEVVRQYRIGAVGVRYDGAIVTSNNIPNRRPHAEAHAEARLARKLDVGSVVYVARIGRSNEFRKARPCPRCRQKLRARGVKRCYYTISDREYGVIDL